MTTLGKALLFMLALLFVIVMAFINPPIAVIAALGLMLIPFARMI